MCLGISTASIQIFICFLVANSPNKKDVRWALMEYQSSGHEDEWQSGNFMIYNIPGLRKSQRILTQNNS